MEGEEEEGRWMVLSPFVLLIGTTILPSVTKPVTAKWTNPQRTKDVSVTTSDVDGRHTLIRQSPLCHICLCTTHQTVPIARTSARTHLENKDRSNEACLRIVQYCVCSPEHDPLQSLQHFIYPFLDIFWWDTMVFELQPGYQTVSGLLKVGKSQGQECTWAKGGPLSLRNSRFLLSSITFVESIYATKSHKASSQKKLCFTNIANNHVTKQNQCHIHWTLVNM